MSNLEPWHFDRRVPLVLILTIVIQTAAMVWWASATTQRVAQIEATIGDARENETISEMRIRSLELTAGRVDERLINMTVTLNRIAALLEEMRP